MKKPTRPRKPKAPVEPMEFVVEENLFYNEIVKKSFSVKEILDLVCEIQGKTLAQLNIENLWITHYCQDSCYTKKHEYVLRVVEKRKIKNENYNSDMEHYNKNVKKYHELYEKYEEKLKVYNKTLPVWKAWQIKKEASSLERDLEKCNKKIKALLLAAGEWKESQ